MLLPIQKNSSTMPDTVAGFWLLHIVHSPRLSLSSSEEKAPLAKGAGLSLASAPLVEHKKMEDTGPMGEKLLFLDIFIGSIYVYRSLPKGKGDVCV